MMNMKFIGSVIIIIPIVMGCNSSSVDSKSVSNDSLETDKKNSELIYYTRAVEGSTLFLGPKKDTLPNEDLIFTFKGRNTIGWETSGLDLSNVTAIRDFGGTVYDLNYGQKYAIRNGALSTFNGESELKYDYNILVSEDVNFEFLQQVKVRFKKGHYSKGENFVSFATIDTIFSDLGDVSVFNETDVEIDFEFSSDSIYEGKLLYVRESIGSNSSKWFRNNFKFEIVPAAH